MGKEGSMRGRWREGMCEGDVEVIMYRDVSLPSKRGG